MTADTEVFQAGVYPDMPEDVYHGDPVPGGSLSCSGAKKLLPPSCPARFFWERANAPQSTKAMEFGTVGHNLVLGTGPRIVIVDTKDWRTKAAQDAAKAARADGAVPMLLADFSRAQELAAAVRAHPLAGALFDPEHGVGEQSLFWPDDTTGVWRRARVDWLRTNGSRTIAVDLKTIVSADHDTIRQHVHRYGYYQQHPWYLDGIRALGLDATPEFVFVFVESSPPHPVVVVHLDDDAISAGDSRNRRAIEIYRDCDDAGIWPDHAWPGDNDGFTDDIRYISLPPWAAREDSL